VVTALVRPVAPIPMNTQAPEHIASSYSPLLSKLGEEDAGLNLFPTGAKSTPKQGLPRAMSAWDLAGMPAIKLSVMTRLVRVTQAQLLAAGSTGCQPRFLQLFVDAMNSHVVRGQKDGVPDPRHRRILR